MQGMRTLKYRAWNIGWLMVEQKYLLYIASNMEYKIMKISEVWIYSIE